MKHLNIFLVAALFIMGVGVSNAQDKNNPWSIEVGVNAVDFFPIETTDDGRFPATTKGGMFTEYFNANDHWNLIPTLSEIKIGKYLDNGFTFAVAGTFNKISRIGDESANDLSYIGADGEIKYSFRELLNDCWFAPYIGVGGGYTWVDNIGFGTANGLLGVDIWVAENLALSAQSTYKHSFEENYGATHFQHTLGVKFKFGGKDTDDDGVYDYEDECPETPGLPEFNGCPDSDGDGIEDREDECPNTPGLAEYNGCPDTDGDGVPDNEDECPTVAGPKENNGCPWPDTDGDTVPDHVDECPDVVGTVANNGCPEVTEAIRKALSSYAKTILFDTGKSSIKTQSAGVLNDIIGIMDEYPNARFSVDGHTDNTGSASFNLTLSKSRASSVVNYLVENGIDADRLDHNGYGEENPLDTNKTSEGRANNRRVEISHIK